MMIQQAHGNEKPTGAIVSADRAVEPAEFRHSGSNPTFHWQSGRDREMLGAAAEPSMRLIGVRAPGESAE